MKKTHKVLDLRYIEEEGNVCFVGTETECLNYLTKQKTDGFIVIPMLPEEIKTKKKTKK